MTRLRRTSQFTVHPREEQQRRWRNRVLVGLLLVCLTALPVLSWHFGHTQQLRAQVARQSREIESLRRTAEQLRHDNQSLIAQRQIDEAALKDLTQRLDQAEVRSAEMREEVALYRAATVAGRAGVAVRRLQIVPSGCQGAHCRFDLLLASLAGDARRSRGRVRIEVSSRDAGAGSVTTHTEVGYDFQYLQHLRGGLAKLPPGKPESVRVMILPDASGKPPGKDEVRFELTLPWDKVNDPAGEMRRGNHAG